MSKMPPDPNPHPPVRWAIKPDGTRVLQYLITQLTPPAPGLFGHGARYHYEDVPEVTLDSGEGQRNLLAGERP